MTAINDRLNAVAEFGDVVPACVVSLCGDASTEIARLQAQVDALSAVLAAAALARQLDDDATSSTH